MCEERQFRFVMESPYGQTVRDVLLDRGWLEVTKGGGEGWDLCWCPASAAREAVDCCMLDTHGRQRVNHFINNRELTTKNMLYRNIRKYKKFLIQSGRTEDAELCDCVPVVFEMPAEYRMFVEEYRKSSRCTWIVKPSRGTQGKGIFLFQKLKELSQCREGWQDQPEWPWLIQRYIERPYLVGRRKLDLRLYVLVTSYRPLRVWTARDGFARVCSAEYSLDRLHDSRSHLTNSTLQITNALDPTNQGCKWSLLKLRKFLTARHGAKRVVAVFDTLARQVVTSLSAVQHAVTQDRRCFELYGYDVLLDQDLRPWLLEVNASPQLTPTSFEDYQMKYDLVEDMFHILDFEQKLTGKELRVGGFDLLWNDGPVYKPSTENDTDRELNCYFGCYNDDRAEQLEKLNIFKKMLNQCKTCVVE